MRNKIAVLLLFVLIPTVIVFDQTIGTTFNGLRLMVASGAVGYLIGALMIKRMERSPTVSSFLDLEAGGVRGLLTAIVTSSVVIVAGLANGNIFLGEAVPAPSEIIRKEADLGGREGSNWILGVRAVDYGHLDLRVRHSTWESVEVGDLLNLSVRKGLAGFHVMIDIEGPAN